MSNVSARALLPSLFTLPEWAVTRASLKNDRWGRCVQVTLAPPPFPALLVNMPHLDQFTDQRQSRARDVHNLEPEGLSAL